MNSRQAGAEEVYNEIRDLQGRFRSLILATASESGSPNASYAPYILHAGSFFILVSQLAKHTGNLLSRPNCHVLFIEEEGATANIFARRRVSCECAVQAIDRDDPLAGRVFEQFTESFGPVVSMLIGLPDFVLFRLRPEQCNYVRGFGQAMQVDVSIFREEPS